MAAPLKPDIYSLGLVLYSMMNLYVPDASYIAQSMSRVYTSNFYSESLCTLLSFVLQFDSSKRPTIDEILEQSIVAE